MYIPSPAYFTNNWGNIASDTTEKLLTFIGGILW